MLLEATAAEQIAFGPFVYDRSSRLLWKEHTPVPLPPRAVGVLGLLLERPGHLMSKQDLLSSVWPDAFVTETSLAEAVSYLRQALADDSQSPTYIQTVHRRGYRFIADVHPVGAGAADVAPAPENASFTQAGQTTQRASEEPKLGLLVPWLITLFALLVSGVAVWKFTRATVPAPRLPARFEIPIAAGLSLASTGSPIAVSRDGTVIAFSACRGSEADCSIYLRPLSQAMATEIAGTRGGSSPFFSPDGRWLGYFADGRLQKIALAGGAPGVLAEAVDPWGATWTDDGRIVFAGAAGRGLSSVSAGGGPVTALTHADRESSHRWPEVLPSGTGVVFTVVADAAMSSLNDSQPPYDPVMARAYAGIASLRTRTWTRLMDGVSAVRAPMDGYVLASRGSDLIGAAFEERSLSLAGTPVTVVPGAGLDSSAPRFAMSRVGTLALAAPGSSVLQIVLDWDGELRRLVPRSQVPLPR